jgi:hypothetical protein
MAAAIEPAICPCEMQLPAKDTAPEGHAGAGSSADNGGRSGPLGQGVSPLCVKGSPLVPQKFRGELFTLTPPNCACYFFGMDCHLSPNSPLLSRTRTSTPSNKNNF